MTYIYEVVIKQNLRAFLDMSDPFMERAIHKTQARGHETIKNGLSLIQRPSFRRPHLKRTFAVNIPSLAFVHCKWLNPVRFL